MKDVVLLSMVGKNDVDIAGGKGANLGELIQNEFPVPPGFVITAQQYALCIGELTMSGHITVEECVDIRKQILDIELTSEFLAKIDEYHEQISQEFPGEFVYAVRSSATAEDLGDASFAGQHDTYYYVTTSELPQMIKKCWASLWSDAAFSYRDAQGIEHKQVNMAVIVQVMIQSDTSGVTFTANPMTGDKDVVITESSWGMGAAIVDGRVSPDRYVINKTTNQLITKRISDKKFMVPSSISPGASRLIEVPAERRRKETLSITQAQTIAMWAIKSEHYFKNPQDIEWAFCNDEFYMLQSRPITVMGVKEDFIPEGPFVLFKPLAENFTDPLLPLSQDIFTRIFPMMRFIKGRAYISANFFRPFLPFKMKDNEVAQLAYLSNVDKFKPVISLPRVALLTVCLLYTSPSPRDS